MLRKPSYYTITKSGNYCQTCTTITVKTTE